MIRRRKSNLPKWRYEFDCRKCDNIREVHDPRKGRDGDYCIPCIERMDSRRPSPIHADEKERVLRCECFMPNSLWTATFTLPADDPKNAYCAPLNFVEIFDGDERIDLFRIIGEDMERSNGATRYYDCEHVLATLLSDVLFQYHQCGGSGVKTADVLNYILARQTRQNWKLGACDFKRYFEYNWENSTLLSAV